MPNVTQERPTRALDQMGPVLSCSVSDCSYNCDDACRAPGVSVSDCHPACETFTVSPARIDPAEAHVSHCGIADCAYNSGGTCAATGVSVTYHSAHADCVTYRQKS